jgi:pimeloyl-ACP methyl ester carboxylesterase
MRNFRLLPASCAMALAMTALPAWGAGPPSCAALKNFQLVGFAIEITKAEDHKAGPAPVAPGAQPAPQQALPAHCRVEGTLDKRIGRNGKPYAIGFAVALPPNWNGRFLYQGGGGLNGSLNPPLGAQFAGEQSALARGFAVASTDSGHIGSGFDATFLTDQRATLNFLYQANAKVTVVAKQIVAKHYGKPAGHSYFVGCSTGGREAMMMSQRFPDLYDGIVAGAPAMRTSYSNLALRWASTALNQIAPKNAQGQPQTREALSDADRKLVVDGALAACDALDGQKDGLIFATKSCRFDPQGSFESRGGKLIFFHGVSDPWFSAQDTVRYYEKLEADTGVTPVSGWSRLFLVPGMGHCSGGDRAPDRFNMVDAIVDWVEKKQAPDRIIATGTSMQGASRPLCPWPAHAQFTSGDPNAAASYSCRE